MIKGKHVIKIKANFQEATNAITNPDIISVDIITHWPNLSPNPNSICSNWAWTLVANSKELFSSNHPCSWVNINLK